MLAPGDGNEMPAEPAVCTPRSAYTPTSLKFNLPVKSVTAMLPEWIIPPNTGSAASGMSGTLSNNVLGNVLLVGFVKLL